MKKWLGVGGVGFVLASSMTVPACSGPNRNFNSHGAAGASGMSAGNTGGTSAAGRSAGGHAGSDEQPSSAGMAGEDMEEMAGAGGDAGGDAGGGCSDGYTGTPSTGCVDINECKTDNGGCDKAVTCTNTPGSRVCGNCPFGYSGDGEAGCVDIDECKTNNGGCDKTVACKNTPGGYTCGDCSAGYTGGGASGCVDIDECKTNNGGCDSLAACMNTPGSFSCGACPTGYTGTGATGCVDIVECLSNNGGCSANAQCTNTAGSRTCACKSGYSGDGITCTAPGAGCKWSCTTPGCAQVALDNDGDGHGSSACAAAPGDDCDDTQSSVFTGASEVCDGIDNDCDKKIDLSDGLALVGAVQDLPSRSHVSIAVGSGGVFQVVGTSPPGTTGLFSGTISSTGTATFYSSPIFSPDANSQYSLTRMAWASGNSQYGVAYAIDGFGGAGTRGGTMAASACCWQDFNLTTASNNKKGDVTARGQGDLLFAGTSDGNITFNTRDGSGVKLTGNLAVSGTWDIYAPRLASSGTSAGVIWQTASPRALNWSLLSPTLVPGATEQLATAASYADISAIGAGYGLAWIEGLGFRFAIKKADGSTQCTSSVVSFGTIPSNQQLAVADSTNGTVVVATSPDSNLIHLYRFDSACKVKDDIDVTTTANAPTEPRVALGGGHVLVFWIDAAYAHYRFLSDLLCH